MDLRIKPIGKGNYKQYNSSNLNTNNVKSVSPLNTSQMAKNLLENWGNESLAKQKNISWVEKYKIKTPTPKSKAKTKKVHKKSKNKINSANNTGYNANINSPKKSTRKTKRKTSLHR